MGGFYPMKLVFDIEEKFNLLPQVFQQRLTIDVNGCWLWNKSLRDSGYGYYRRRTPNGIVRYSMHRHIYSLFNNLEDGSLVLHKCDVRSCCNPDHLYSGTNKQNSDDMRSRNRAQYVRGERQGASKLTELQVLEIRADTNTQRVIADRYNISQTSVWSIKNRISWGWLNE